MDRPLCFTSSPSFAERARSRARCAARDAVSRGAGRLATDALRLWCRFAASIAGSFEPVIAALSSGLAMLGFGGRGRIPIGRRWRLPLSPCCCRLKVVNTDIGRHVDGGRHPREPSIPNWRMDGGERDAITGNSAERAPINRLPDTRRSSRICSCSRAAPTRREVRGSPGGTPIRPPFGALTNKRGATGTTSSTYFGLQTR